MRSLIVRAIRTFENSEIRSAGNPFLIFLSFLSYLVSYLLILIPGSEILPGFDSARRRRRQRSSPCTASTRSSSGRSSPASRAPSPRAARRPTRHRDAWAAPEIDPVPLTHDDQKKFFFFLPPHSNHIKFFKISESSTERRFMLTFHYTFIEIDSCIENKVSSATETEKTKTFF